MERKGTDTKIEEMSPREMKSLEAGTIVQVEVVAFGGTGSGIYLVEYRPQAKKIDHVINLSDGEILRKALTTAL